MKRVLTALIAVLVLGVVAGVAVAAQRPIPERNAAVAIQDTTGTGLPGDQADLQKALQESSKVKYQVLVIDTTDGEPQEAYLDRLLEKWGWPQADTLQLVIYTKANYDMYFAMGANFQAQKVSIQEMLDLLHNTYVPEVRKGDPSHALAQFIRAINQRMGSAN
ncbi:MAG: TPM domain-containing protein [Mycobacterium leprae]